MYGRVCNAEDGLYRFAGTSAKNARTKTAGGEGRPVGDSVVKRGELREICGVLWRVWLSVAVSPDCQAAGSPSWDRHPDAVSRLIQIAMRDASLRNI